MATAATECRSKSLRHKVIHACNGSTSCRQIVNIRVYIVLVARGKCERNVDTALMYGSPCNFSMCDFEDKNSHIPVFLGASTAESSHIPVFLDASTAESSHIPVFLDASTAESSDIPVFLGASTAENSHIPVFLGASTAENSHIHVFLSALTAENSHIHQSK